MSSIAFQEPSLPKCRDIIKERIFKFVFNVIIKIVKMKIKCRQCCNHIYNVVKYFSRKFHNSKFKQEVSNNQSKYKEISDCLFYLNDRFSYTHAFSTSDI